MPGIKSNSLLANLSDSSLFLLQFVLHTIVSLIFTKHWPKSFHASHRKQDWTITPWHSVCPKQMSVLFPAPHTLASVPIITLFSSAAKVLDHKKFLSFKMYSCLSSNYPSSEHVFHLLFYIRSLHKVQGSIKMTSSSGWPLLDSFTRNGSIMKYLQFILPQDQITCWPCFSKVKLWVPQLPSVPGDLHISCCRGCISNRYGAFPLSSLAPLFFPGVLSLSWYF